MTASKHDEGRRMFDINRHGFIEIPTSRHMLIVAQSRAAQNFARFGGKSSHITEDEQRGLRGALAEEAVRAAFPKLRYAARDDTRLDLFVGSTFFDVKSQGCNTPPQPHFAAGIQLDHTKHSDVLIFCRVLRDLSWVWIVGWDFTNEFMRPENIIPLGTRKPNGYVVKSADRCEKPMSALKKPADLAKFIDEIALTCR